MTSSKTKIDQSQKSKDDKYINSGTKAKTASKTVTKKDEKTKGISKNEASASGAKQSSVAAKQSTKHTITNTAITTNEILKSTQSTGSKKSTKSRKNNPSTLLDPSLPSTVIPTKANSELEFPYEQDQIATPHNVIYSQILTNEMEESKSRVKSLKSFNKSLEMEKADSTSSSSDHKIVTEKIVRPDGVSMFHKPVANEQDKEVTFVASGRPFPSTIKYEKTKFQTKSEIEKEKMMQNAALKEETKKELATNSARSPVEEKKNIVPKSPTHFPRKHENMIIPDRAGKVEFYNELDGEYYDVDGDSWNKDVHAVEAGNFVQGSELNHPGKNESQKTEKTEQQSSESQENADQGENSLGTDEVNIMDHVKLEEIQENQINSSEKNEEMEKNGSDQNGEQYWPTVQKKYVTDQITLMDGEISSMKQNIELLDRIANGDGVKLEGETKVLFDKDVQDMKENVDHLANIGQEIGSLNEEVIILNRWNSQLDVIKLEPLSQLESENYEKMKASPSDILNTQNRIKEKINAFNDEILSTKTNFGNLQNTILVIEDWPGVDNGKLDDLNLVVLHIQENINNIERIEKKIEFVNDQHDFADTSEMAQFITSGEVMSSLAADSIVTKCLLDAQLTHMKGNIDNVENIISQQEREIGDLPSEHIDKIRENIETVQNINKQTDPARDNFPEQLLELNDEMEKMKENVIIFENLTTEADVAEIAENTKILLQKEIVTLKENIGIMENIVDRTGVLNVQNNTEVTEGGTFRDMLNGENEPATRLKKLSTETNPDRTFRLRDYGEINPNRVSRDLNGKHSPEGISGDLNGENQGEYDKNQPDNGRSSDSWENEMVLHLYTETSGENITDKNESAVTCKHATDKNHFICDLPPVSAKKGCWDNECSSIDLSFRVKITNRCRQQNQDKQNCSDTTENNSRKTKIISNTTADNSEQNRDASVTDASSNRKSKSSSTTESLGALLNRFEQKLTKKKNSKDEEPEGDSSIDSELLMKIILNPELESQLDDKGKEAIEDYIRPLTKFLVNYLSPEILANAIAKTKKNVSWDESPKETLRRLSEQINESPTGRAQSISILDQMARLFPNVRQASVVIIDQLTNLNNSNDGPFTDSEISQGVENFLRATARAWGVSNEEIDVNQYINSSRSNENHRNNTASNPNRPWYFTILDGADMIQGEYWGEEDNE